ncbi:MAG: DUF86 domain-containing protein [Deltaproteobacteria bacterium]|nr:DUF86 domain-containing protein [Deltaproteobacteria bacterium]MBW1940856.1 DUF86 domain-containing protein [Deltaproteobacteria bacterium]MBW2010858.1 DUF86 domain-containing protein [Deltaproteobacteria bacterium]MBW2099859.1 DUF86 domain-containing protein [Deltaproteobacteria bacterium]
MKPEIKKYLFDIQEAISDIEEFTDGKEYDEYELSRLLQAAVERKFEIIGEALNRIKSVDSEFIEDITDYRRIIGFRNIIAHGYDVLESELVWTVIKKHLPILKKEVTEFINA